MTNKNASAGDKALGAISMAAGAPLAAPLVNMVNWQ